MKKKSIVIELILILLLGAGIFSSLYIGNQINLDSPYNKARILVSEDMQFITIKSYEKVDFDFYAFDLTGKVLYSNVKDVSADDLVNLQEELQIDHAFLSNNQEKVKLLFPIVGENNTTEGFAVFFLSKNALDEMTGLEKGMRMIAPLILWGILVLSVLIIRQLKLKKEILKPMKEISDSVEAIIQGNYNKEVIQRSNNKILDSEIDVLSYSYELMRDELKNKAQREEKLNRIQRELMSCISHDLRTPISTIKAHAEALRDGLATDEEKRNRYVNTIINKTDILTKMIKDLLEQFNAELNQLSIVKTDLYADAYFSSLEKELEIYCNHYQTEFHMENSLPKILISIDKDRINQVIYNLIENAIKYNDKADKKIILKTWFDESRKLVFVSIADNGAGIQMTDIPYVFQAFYRAEKSRSIEIPGSGLGLSICKYIVEAHAGQIQVKSKTNQGSEFIFYLVS